MQHGPAVFLSNLFDKGGVSMKKRQMVVWIVLILIVGIFVAWRIGYSTRKSNDNLPALTSIAQMSEAEVNNVLPGYQISQLR